MRAGRASGPSSHGQPTVGETMATKCEITGCKNPAVWIATKLWGKGGTICTCDECKPGKNVSPAIRAALKGRTFYDVKPLGEPR